MSRPEDWLERLYSLIARFPQYRAGADLASLTLADLWGLWRLLERVAREGGP